MLPRWTQIGIAGFWLASMSWLAATKVVPPMLVGDAPSYRSIVRDATPGEGPVSWSMQWDDRPIGWARTSTEQRPDGTVELESRVHFNELPLAEVAPAWLSPLVKLLRGSQPQLTLEARGTMEVDPLGRLIGVSSEIDLGDLPNAVTVSGLVDGNQIRLTVRSGEFSYFTNTSLPSDSMIGDALSPQARLPRLHVGQRWTVPVHSPFRPPNMPLEILAAEVLRDDEVIIWDGTPVKTWLVEYTSDEGSGLHGGDRSRGKVWVRHDGVVLKQELRVTRARLTFLRDPQPREVVGPR